jgi:hypothetical protein
MPPMGLSMLGASPYAQLAASPSMSLALNAPADQCVERLAAAGLFFGAGNGRGKFRHRNHSAIHDGGVPGCVLG